MQATASLPLPTRSAIVLIALLQGLLLHTVQVLADSWPFDHISLRFVWYVWVLTVPSAIALSLIELRQRALWLHAGLASLLVLALAAWLGSQLRGATGLDPSPLMAPFSIALAVATFVSLPWWQHRLESGQWRADYDSLFRHAWQNGLTLALAVAFTGLTWLLLWLWGALFALLKVELFREVFRDDAFIALATGALAGFGVLIGRTQERAIQITRQILFAICKGLLPLLAFIAVLFVLSLPFTGLENLWQTRSAATLLLILALLLVGFSNAVYQHDDGAPPYPTWLRRLVEVSLLTLPVLAILALQAMWLRVDQYGWTTDRFWAALIAVIISGYAVGYAIAVFHRGGRWLQGLESANRWMCRVVFAACLLACSPLLDPARITVASQTARLQADPAQITPQDATLLRFSLGMQGVEGLQALLQKPEFAADKRASSIAQQALDRKKRWGDHDEILNPNTDDIAMLRARLPLVKGSAQAPDSWWQGLQNKSVYSMQCLEPDTENECVVVSRDVNNDGRDEVLLCRLTPRGGPMCRLHALDAAGTWQAVGYYDLGRDVRDREAAAKANRALREGQLQVQVPLWPALTLDGKTQSTMTPSELNAVAFP